MVWVLQTLAQVRQNRMVLGLQVQEPRKDLYQPVWGLQRDSNQVLVLQKGYLLVLVLQRLKEQVLQTDHRWVLERAIRILIRYEKEN